MSEELLVFPCEFPIKIMGRDTPEFRDVVSGIVERHAELVEDEGPRSRESRRGRYVSLSFLLYAQSREQLDALYTELTAREDVLWVL